MSSIFALPCNVHSLNNFTDVALANEDGYSVLVEDVTSPKSYLLGTRIGTIRQIAQVVVKKMTQSLALCRPSQIEHVGQCGF